MSSPNPRPAAPPVVLRVQEPYSSARDMLRFLPASIASAIFHAALILLIWLFPWGGPPKQEETLAAAPPPGPSFTPPPKDPFVAEDVNPFSEDFSTDIVYKGERVEKESVPGIHVPKEKIGIIGGDLSAMPHTIAPPPGFGKIGTGGAVLEGKVGNTLGIGTPGGYGPRGVPLAGSFYGRSGSTKRLALTSGGGTGPTEAAVTKGLKWILTIQSPDGSWHLDSSKFKDTGINNDVAGTAFGLLPLLGAGKTHKMAPPDPQEQKFNPELAKLAKDEVDKLEKAYSNAVYKGLMYLIRVQDKKTGSFNSNMYAHGLATIAMCEAYGLTQDANLKRYAQMGVNYIVYAQHNEGGWRYGPKQAGDTSVVGWQVMALKSAQMAGLDVPDLVMKKAVNFLEKVCDQTNEGYGYTGPGSTPTLTSIGLLCRQYIQSWGPKNPRMQKAISIVKGSGPILSNMYYTYYATQVMHHFGGQAWDEWNEKMRTMLLAGQDGSTGPLRGSWSGAGSHVSGRLMQTSLCLCTLEVYYRHLPLYYRHTDEMVAGKE